MSTTEDAIGDIDELEALLQEYWNKDGAAHKSSFRENSTKFLGDELLLGRFTFAVTEIVMEASQDEGPQAVASLLVGLVKRAYYKGKESMVQ